MVLHAPIEFERVASKHARLAGTTVALITLRCSTRLARGQQEGARCGCFRFGRLPASVWQLLTLTSRIDDACPPRSSCGRATKCREEAGTFSGQWWPGSARSWLQSMCAGVISAGALRTVNVERIREVLVVVKMDRQTRYLTEWCAESVSVLALSASTPCTGTPLKAEKGV